MNGTRPEKSRLYHQRIGPTWWLKKRSYFLFMLREISSVFVALFLVIYLVQIARLSGGLELYLAFVRRLGGPGWILFHLIALAFALYHSYTWFASSATVLPVRLGERVLQRGAVVALNLCGLVAVSVVILILFISLQG